MAIRSSLLALLAEGDSYGYELKRSFEERTGGTWPINIGQIYSTLSRLERDGLVESAGEDGEGHVVYRITAPGRAEARDWYATATQHDHAPRDELTIKVALAMTSTHVDVATLMDTQRAASLHRLQELTRLKSDPTKEPAWALVLDRMIFIVDAELRWLDHCEQRVVRAQRERARHAGPSAAPAPAALGGATAPALTQEEL